MVYSVFLWRNGFRRDNRVSYLLLLAGFGLHTGAMFARGLRLNHCPVHNLYETTAFVMWTIVALYLVMGLWARLRFLGAFASPVLFGIGVFALMPSLDATHNSQPELPAAWTSLHAALMALAYGAFGLSAVAALMFLTQERNLKFHKLQAIFSLMPPIQRLEAAVGRLLTAGFILLTVGLASGVVDLTHLNNPHQYRGDPKIVWSVGVWLLYFGLHYHALAICAGRAPLCAERPRQLRLRAPDLLGHECVVPAAQPMTAPYITAFESRTSDFGLRAS